MLLRLVKTELFMGKIGTGLSLPETVALGALHAEKKAKNSFALCI